MNKQAQKFDSYKPIHTRQELIDLIEQVLCAKIQFLERKNLGESNAVYFAKTENDQEYVIRISPKEKGHNKFQEEAWAFEKCRTKGIPTPEVIAVDTSLSKFPEAYMITKRIPGLPLNTIRTNKKQKEELLQQLGHYLFLIHSIKLQGFGGLKKEGDKFVGKFSSLWESIINELEEGWWIQTVLKKGYITQDKLEEYKKLFLKNKGSFQLKTGSLIHGDISLKNTIAANSKTTGIVDMENLSAGDPVRDFQRFNLLTNGNEFYFKSLQNGYDNKSLFNEEFMKKLYLYQLINSHSLIAFYFLRNNTKRAESFAKRVPLIEKRLRELL